jgi:hypothetical protein
MSGSGALGGALAGVALAFLGYDGLSFVALALVAVVVGRVLVTWRHASPVAGGPSEALTFDI